MTIATLIKKKAFNWLGWLTSRGLIHYHHGRERLISCRQRWFWRGRWEFYRQNTNTGPDFSIWNPKFSYWHTSSNKAICLLQGHINLNKPMIPNSCQTAPLQKNQTFKYVSHYMVQDQLGLHETISQKKNQWIKETKKSTTVVQNNILSMGKPSKDTNSW